MKRRNAIAFLVALALIFPVLVYFAIGNKTVEIEFNLGKNVHETAKASGAPRFEKRNVVGLISYALIDVPAEIFLSYNRPGYEVRIPNVFSLRLYADSEHGSGLVAETAALMISNKEIATHESAQAYVEGLIKQFQGGKWKRHLDPLCPAVMGRSSYLDEHGKIGQLEACSLDPQYRIPAEDWPALMHNPQNYEWIGDGILARLSIGYMEGSLGLRYTIDLDFDIFEVKKARDKNNLARRLQEGDANGWDSTAKMKKDIEALRVRVKTWEDAARQRGDVVISR